MAEVALGRGDGLPAVLYFIDGAGPFRRTGFHFAGTWARRAARLLCSLSFFSIGEAGIALRKPPIPRPETVLDSIPRGPTKALVGLVSVVFCNPERVLHERSRLFALERSGT